MVTIWGSRNEEKGEMRNGRGWTDYIPKSNTTSFAAMLHRFFRDFSALFSVSEKRIKLVHVDSIRPN